MKMNCLVPTSYNVPKVRCSKLSVFLNKTSAFSKITNLFSRYSVCLWIPEEDIDMPHRWLRYRVHTINICPLEQINPLTLCLGANLIFKELLEIDYVVKTADFHRKKTVHDSEFVMSYCHFIYK